MSQINFEERKEFLKSQGFMASWGLAAMIYHTGMTIAWDMLNENPQKYQNAPIDLVNESIAKTIIAWHIRCENIQESDS